MCFMNNDLAAANSGYGVTKLSLAAQPCVLPVIPQSIPLLLTPHISLYELSSSSLYPILVAPWRPVARRQKLIEASLLGWVFAVAVAVGSLGSSAIDELVRLK